MALASQSHKDGDFYSQRDAKTVRVKEPHVVRAVRLVFSRGACPSPCPASQGVGNFNYRLKFEVELDVARLKWL